MKNFTSMVMVVGQLAHDPEFTTAKSGDEYVKLSIVNESGNLHFVAFNTNVETARSLKAGALISIQGYLRTRTNTSNSGGTFVNIDFTCSRIEPIGEIDVAQPPESSRPAQTQGDPF